MTDHGHSTAPPSAGGTRGTGAAGETRAMTTPTTHAGTAAAAGPARRRLAAAAGAALVTAVALSGKAWAEAALPDRVVGIGLVDLRLVENPGVAFSVGAGSPSWLVVTVTATITIALGVFAWRTAAGNSRWLLAALALIIGGATANLLDRVGDGVVTDFLHTGWWPTFNVADIAVVTGVALLVLASLRPGAPPTSSERGKDNRSSPSPDR